MPLSPQRRRDAEKNLSSCFSLCLCVSAVVFALAQSDKVRVHGALPPGARLEFQAVGSPERVPAESDAAGKYSLELSSGRYDILLTYPSKRRARGAAWLSGQEVELNAAAENPKPSTSAEYDLMAEWRVVNESATGVGPAKVILEVEPPRGAPQKLSAWIPAGDEEKEVAGSLETTPDGRFVFRVRDSRLRPDAFVALRVRVSMEGYAPATLRLAPVLEFSEAGHFYAHYPEEGVEIKITKSPNR